MAERGQVSRGRVREADAGTATREGRAPEWIHGAGKRARGAGVATPKRRRRGVKGRKRQRLQARPAYCRASSGDFAAMGMKLGALQRGGRQMRRGQPVGAMGCSISGDAAGRARRKSGRRCRASRRRLADGDGARWRACVASVFFLPRKCLFMT